MFSFSILGNYETLPVRSGLGNNMAVELNPAKEQSRIITFVMEDKVEPESEEKEVGNFQRWPKIQGHREKMSFPVGLNGSVLQSP